MQDVTVHKFVEQYQVLVCVYQHSGFFYTTQFIDTSETKNNKNVVKSLCLLLTFIYAMA